MYQLMELVQQGEPQGLDFTGAGPTGIGGNFSTSYSTADHQQAGMLGGILQNQMPAFPHGHGLPSFRPYGLAQPTMPQQRTLQELAAYQEVERSLTQSLPLPHRAARFEVRSLFLFAVSTLKWTRQPQLEPNVKTVHRRPAGLLSSVTRTAVTELGVHCGLGVLNIVVIGDTRSRISVIPLWACGV
jgi:hypothetical protein